MKTCLTLLLTLSAGVLAADQLAAPVALLSPDQMRAKAVAVVIAAAAGEDPALRSNAIEAMQPLPDRALPLTTKGLSDKNPGVRFAAAVTAGVLKFRDLSPAIEPLLQDPNPSVRAAGLYALHTLGEKVDITPLGDMLASQDPALRSNVALLLGLLGDGSAVPMLKHAANKPMPRVSEAHKTVVRLQIAEAIARLGDNDSLDALRAGIYGQYHEVRVLSVTAIGAVGDRSMEVAMENLLRDPDVDKPPRGSDAETHELARRLRTEIQLAAAGALARMGNMRGGEFAVEKAGDSEPVIRAQAAWVLGWMTDEPGLLTLHRLMSDRVPQVRVAAAASMIRRLKGK